MPTFAFTLLWNVALTTAFAILIGLLCRLKILRHQPRLTHALWLLVLAKLVTPPLIPLPVLPALKVEKAFEVPQLGPFDVDVVGSEPTLIGQNLTEGDLALQSHVSATHEGIATNGSFTDLLSSVAWFAILAGISGLGTCVLITASLSQLWRVSRILRRALSSDVRLNELAQTAASRMGMRRSPVVCSVDSSVTPLLWVRLSDPVIVMPSSLAERMSDKQITCIFCHELAHYVRRDHWFNTFAFLVVALFWWHPVAWWALREMRACQEECCDGLALATGAATRRCYAETLLQTLEFVQTKGSFHAHLVSGFGSSSSIQRRFEMIANLNVSRHFSRWAAALVVACAVAMLCVPVPGRSQTAADESRGIEASQTVPATTASDDQAWGAELSGRNSKDYRLAEKEADHLVDLLKTFGHEEIYIWAYDREKGTTSITASPRDHQLIMSLIQLLAKDQQSPRKEFNKVEGKVWPRLGLTLEPVDASQVRRINPTLRGGLKVVAVLADSPAALLGVREGDVVIGLSKWETVSLKDFDWVLSRHQPNDGEPLPITFLRNVPEGSVPVVEPALSPVWTMTTRPTAPAPSKTF